MNILLVNKYHYVTGGPERYMFGIKKLLEQVGCTVIPLCLDVDGNKPSPYSGHFLPSPFGKRQSHWEGNLNPARQAVLLARAVYYPKAASVAADICRRHDIDTVYLLNICNYISPSVIKAVKRCGAKVLMRLSDFNMMCPAYHFYRDGRVCFDCEKSLTASIRYRCLRESRVLSTARSITILAHRIMKVYDDVDYFLAPSRFMLEKLVGFGIERERCVFLPSFFDKHQLSPPFRSGNSYALYFGRLSREKGIDILLHAARILKYGKRKILIIGDGPDEPRLKKMARELGLDNVTFLPFMRHEELEKYVLECKFTVTPSLWHDNSPMSVYESMAYGKPVVASRLGGLPDQIGDDEAGILVEPTDPESLAQNMERLYEDDDLCLQLGNMAHERTKSLFSPRAHLDKLLPLLKPES